jgi:hypothetical protein
MNAVCIAAICWKLSGKKGKAAKRGREIATRALFLPLDHFFQVFFSSFSLKWPILHPPLSLFFRSIGPKNAYRSPVYAPEEQPVVTPPQPV